MNTVSKHNSWASLTADQRKQRLERMREGRQRAARVKKRTQRKGAQQALEVTSLPLVEAVAVHANAATPHSVDLLATLIVAVWRKLEEQK